MIKINNIALAIITGLAIIGLNLLIPYHSQQKSQDFYVDQPQPGQDMAYGNQADGLSKENHPPEILRGRAETKPPNQDPPAVNEDKDPAANKVDLDTRSGMDSQDQEEGPSARQELEVIEEAVVGEQTWMEEKLSQYEDEIPEEDMRDFEKITGKIDMSHALGFLDNPGGEEGETQLKQYLRSNLSSQEYERTKELFFLYNYILLE